MGDVVEGIRDAFCESEGSLFDVCIMLVLES